MISLFENNREADDICVYLVSKDISESNIDILRGICDKYQSELIVINFDDIAYDLDLSSTGRHIATIYTKVFFPRIEGVDKMIYLDSDTVVVGKLQELWDMPLDNCYMGVVETLPSKFSSELGLPADAPFFNDGMAICNVDYCRQHNLIGQVLQVVRDYNGTPPTLSEGALNKVCYGKVKYISPRYNLMAGILYLCQLDIDYMFKLLHYPKEELEFSCQHPVVIHYLTAFYDRPWFTNCKHPYKDQYHKYKAISPWKDEPLKEHSLPRRIIWIDRCYKIFGIRITEFIRKFTK